MFLRMENRSPGMLSVCAQGSPSGALGTPETEECGVSSAAAGAAYAAGPFASDGGLCGRPPAIDTNSRFRPDVVGGGLLSHFFAWIPKHPRLACLARHTLILALPRILFLVTLLQWLVGVGRRLGGGFAIGAVCELVVVTEGAAVRTVALRTAAQAAGLTRLGFVSRRCVVEPWRWRCFLCA
jgi:hypothetical protein